MWRFHCVTYGFLLSGFLSFFFVPSMPTLTADKLSGSLGPRTRPPSGPAKATRRPAFTLAHWGERERGKSDGNSRNEV